MKKVIIKKRRNAKRQIATRFPDPDIKLIKSLARQNKCAAADVVREAWRFYAKANNLIED